VEINPFIYIGSGGIVLVIAFLSVFYQALKAAVINPSDTLRNE
jgi:putative ABC transport system permease protein